MHELLSETFHHTADIKPDVLGLRLGAAFLLGLVIAFIYWATHRQRSRRVQEPRR